MSYQIVKSLREDGGDIVCKMAANNVQPRYYYEWRKPKTEENLAMVRKFIIDKVWQPIHKNTKFINELGIVRYCDGTNF